MAWQAVLVTLREETGESMPRGALRRRTGIKCHSDGLGSPEASFLGTPVSGGGGSLKYFNDVLYSSSNFYHCF